MGSSDIETRSSSQPRDALAYPIHRSTRPTRRPYAHTIQVMNDPSSRISRYGYILCRSRLSRGSDALREALKSDNLSVTESQSIHVRPSRHTRPSRPPADQHQPGPAFSTTTWRRARPSPLDDVRAVQTRRQGCVVHRQVPFHYTHLLRAVFKAEARTQSSSVHTGAAAVPLHTRGRRALGQAGGVPSETETGGDDADGYITVRSLLPSAVEEQEQPPRRNMDGALPSLAQPVHPVFSPPRTSLNADLHADLPFYAPPSLLSCRWRLHWS
ncbi:hypothetical protein K438DRAFT_1748477 [Mycena galopus ATCC 62051]|nr:hypothetical protein K438DRAFT_1748477 [Mycena galopus ATCC 62051]